MNNSTPILVEVIESLRKDSTFLNGQNDMHDDKVVGQYLKTVADDLEENYLPKEQFQLSAVNKCIEELTEALKEKDLIIYGIEEGGAEWESQYKSLLKEHDALVKLMGTLNNSNNNLPNI